MNDKFESMIALMDELTETLTKLSDMQREIVKAVRADDIARLAECMKHEQAISLTMRNIDQKRIKIQEQLGFKEIKLSQLPSKVKDPDMQIKVRKAADRLTAQYKIVRSTSEVARLTLESNLRNVEQMMEKMGLDPTQTHQSSISGVHTDFHA